MQVAVIEVCVEKLLASKHFGAQPTLEAVGMVLFFGLLLMKEHVVVEVQGAGG